MDYGTATGTGVLAATGVAISIATGLWLPLLAVAFLAGGILWIRFGFRRGKRVDDL